MALVWRSPFALSGCFGRCMQLHTTSCSGAKARTRESRPVPGSEEHLDPTAWAKRLFQLHEKRRCVLRSSASSAEPPLLHMVCRVKPLKGVPHYQRAVLERHGLGEGTKNHSWILVKNTPSINQDLYVIKHLVRIQPVKFPQGLPTADDDLTKCRLLPDGRFFRYPKDSVSGELVTENTATVLPLSSVSIPTEDASKVFQHSTDDKGYLTRTYLREYHNRRWNKFQLFDEFFTSHYRYKLNQDGSEYRYSRLWRLDNAMFHAIRKQRNPDGTLKAPNQTRFEANWSTYPWSKF